MLDSVPVLLPSLPCSSLGRVGHSIKGFGVAILGREDLHSQLQQADRSRWSRIRRGTVEVKSQTERIAARAGRNPVARKGVTDIPSGTFSSNTIGCIRDGDGSYR